MAACNINFNRELLHTASAMGKTIATDVHVIRDVEDDYDREFLEHANIVFLRDEGLPCVPAQQVSNTVGQGMHCSLHSYIFMPRVRTRWRHFGGPSSLPARRFASAALPGAS